MAAPTDKSASDGRGGDTYSRDQFYADDLNLPDSTRELLEKYSKIPPGHVEDHVRRVREKAWSIHPYPCIGEWRFLHLAIGTHTLYKSEILPRMLSREQTYLDLGCAFAQNVRRLVADGVDSSKCYGADLQLDFLELGYELFNDRETLKSEFMAADIFDPDSPLKNLVGQIDMLEASSFFHLFSWDDQKTIARRVVKLLKPQKDSLLVGRQVGTPQPGEYTRRSGQGSRYRHNLESWEEMWKEVGEELDVRFDVQSKFMDAGSRARWGRPEDEGAKMMEFSVRRL